MERPIPVVLKDVGLTYHSSDGETKAVEHLSLTLKYGDILGIVGPSGSGKTTLLSVVAGILAPTEGKVEVCGLPPSEGKDKCGYMLQRDELFPWLTIIDNVLLSAKVKGLKDRRAYAENLLDKYGLKAYADRYPRELSGGMRQRVALIRTLVPSPEILLLDEPFGALDFQTRVYVVDDVRKIIKNEGKSALFVTHDISEAISMCDALAVLSARPAHVKKFFDLSRLAHLSPMQRRDDPSFGALYDEVWKALEFKKENEI